MEYTVCGGLTVNHPVRTLAGAILEWKHFDAVVRERANSASESRRSKPDRDALEESKNWLLARSRSNAVLTHVFRLRVNYA